MENNARVKELKLVFAWSQEGFDASINEALRKGYQPYGELIVNINVNKHQGYSDYKPYFCMLMAKY